MNIILSTRNPSKAEQIQNIFENLPITVLTLEQAKIEGEGTEDGETLKENSLKKAIFAYDNLTEKTWTMADDTGLFINALNGAPGIWPARWAGEDATTDEITQFTIEKMKDKNDRSATFETVVTLISPEGNQYFFNGEVNGILLEAPRVKPQPKMPYSPLFIPEGSTKVWAEMSIEEENSISHRGIAFRKVRDFLQEHLS